MKHIAYLFSLLLTLTGCLHDPQTDVEEAGKTYVSAQIELFTRATANAEASAVKVESLRLLAFNEDGKCVLHFQLRKETTKLNPESWIGR